jgi:hypothetical protein
MELKKMANIEVTITAINMRDFKRQLQEWCEELGVVPETDPSDILAAVDLDSLRQHLEDRLRDQGFTLDIKAMIDEVVEVKAPKKARKEKAPELVLTVEKDDPKLEAVKTAVLAQLKDIYLAPGGKAQVDAILKRYGEGVGKVHEIPADKFPAIAEELKTHELD